MPSTGTVDGFESIAEMGQLVLRFATGALWIERRLSLSAFLTTSLFAFESFTIGSFFSLVDPIVPDRCKRPSEP